MLFDALKYQEILTNKVYFSQNNRGKLDVPPLFLQWRITTGNPLSRPKERAWKRGCFLLDSNHAISWEHRNNFNRNFESRYVAHSLKQQVNLKSYWYLDAPTSSTLSPEQEMENRQSILNYGDQLADYLRKGLADNWSQVGLFSIN